MVVPDNTKDGNMIYDMKFSSVGPAEVTGTDVIHEPTNMDLAMKLHYVRAVYYFKPSSVVEGLAVPTVKEALFRWFNLYPHTCGRFKRTESGRPFIRCNDAGARFIEAKCTKTIDEWLEMKGSLSLHNLLVSNQVLGPELAISPPIYIQMTTFKCGGKALGFSWAHVLGDAFSLSHFLHLLGQILSGQYLPKPSCLPEPPEKKGNNESNNPSLVVGEPLSVKRVEPVGDHWITANNCKMETYSFRITTQQLKAMSSKMFSSTAKISLFETLSAVFWQCLARTREGSEPKTITICRRREKGSCLISNNQMISNVQVDFSVKEADPKLLAAFILESQKVDEKTKIEEMMEKDEGLSDLIIYGANLTFVDLEESDFYGFEVKKQKPVFVNYTIDGIGDEGLILVMKDYPAGNVDGDEGRTVTVVLPGNQILKLKDELQRGWSIV